MQDLTSALKREAAEVGFSACRVCRPTDVPEVMARLQAFVAAGRHGQMGWMAERMGWRGDPAALWPEARSVVMLAENYGPEGDPLAVLSQVERGSVSVYAQGRDYHDVVKKRLKRLGRWLIEAGGSAGGGSWAGGAPEIKVFVDTAPVMEKPLGQAAGLGWQGKHTNLVSRELGSWFFLGCIFTTLELGVDAPEVDHCGSCRKCLDVCPTGAFPAPYQLDARRCISYLTIEHRGPVDLDLRPGLGNRIYGCDDCLAVCPWNKFAQAAQEVKYRPVVGAPLLADLAGLDDAAFRERFSGSPIKRIGRDRMVRNVLYAIGNSGGTSGGVSGGKSGVNTSDTVGAARLRSAAQALCEDPDAAVCDAARWAVKRLEV